MIFQKEKKKAWHNIVLVEAIVVVCVVKKYFLNIFF